MSHQKVEAGSGWKWITEGWELFMKNPGIWIVLALIWFVVNFVLGLIPLLGGLAAALIGPALAGGMLYGARELDHDRSLEVPHLFQAFRDSDRTVPMILLGLVPLVMGVVYAMLVAGIVGGAALTGAATGSDTATMGMMAGGGLVALVLGMALWFIVSAAMLFAIPQVMLAKAEPIKAVKDSFQASIANIGAFAVFVLILFLLGILAMIPFGLGFLLLWPVAMGAVYSANKQVFGAGDPTQEIPSAAPAGGDAPAESDVTPEEKGPEDSGPDEGVSGPDQESPRT